MEASYAFGSLISFCFTHSVLECDVRHRCDRLIMNNLVLSRLPRYAPDIDPNTVLQIGAGGLQDTFSGETLRGTRQAFVDGRKGA